MPSALILAECRMELGTEGMKDVAAPVRDEHLRVATASENQGFKIIIVTFH